MIESLNINCFVNDINNPNDDFFDWDGSPTIFSGINGTEGNSTGDINSQETRPDTEDINGDQFLDDINSYFTYDFNLNDNSIIESTLSTNWRLYRILC